MVIKAFAKTTLFAQKARLTEVLPGGGENLLGEKSTAGPVEGEIQYGEIAYQSPSSGSTIRVEIQHQNGTWINSKDKLETASGSTVHKVRSVDVDEDDDDEPPEPWDDSVISVTVS